MVLAEQFAIMIAVISLRSLERLDLGCVHHSEPVCDFFYSSRCFGGSFQSLQRPGEIGVGGREDFLPVILVILFHELGRVTERLDGGVMIALFGMEATFQPEVKSPFRVREDGIVNGGEGLFAVTAAAEQGGHVLVDVFVAGIDSEALVVGKQGIVPIPE